ncbi:MAG: hypothetical protein KGS72_22120 [Cyanobacteria bacterium REEB67]|nr:hypothetical protein [Cyanobacteria bacterium REEB67]
MAKGKGQETPKLKKRGRKDEGRSIRNLMTYALLAPHEEKADASYHWGAEGKLKSIFDTLPELKPLTLSRGRNTPEKAAYSDYRKERREADIWERARQHSIKEEIEAFRQKLDEQGQIWIMRLTERLLEIPRACKCDSCKCSGTDCKCEARTCIHCPAGLPCPMADAVRAAMVYQWRMVAASVLNEDELAEFFKIIMPVHEAKKLIGRHLLANPGNIERSYYAKGKPV